MRTRKATPELPTRELCSSSRRGVNARREEIRDASGRFYLEQEFYDSDDRPFKTNPRKRVRRLDLVQAVRALIRGSTCDERFQQEAMALLSPAGRRRTLVTIGDRAACRFREIEQAADLAPGSFLNTMMEMPEQWWGRNGPAELESWICGTWEIEDPKLRAELVALWKKWRAEDVAAKGGVR